MTYFSPVSISGSMRVGKEEIRVMSSSEKRENWLDQWWPLFVIVFGILFVSVLVSWKPVT